MGKIKDWSEFLKDVPTDILKKELEIRDSNKVTWKKLLKSKKIDDLTLYIMRKIDEALNDFGKYSFNDKGPDEVMDFDDIMKSLEKKDANEVGKVLKDILDYYQIGTSVGDYSNAEATVNTIINGLDHREDFEEILDYDDRFEY